MENLTALAADPAVWAALATLIAMEVVLGIDNLIFISILSNKLPEHQRSRGRRIGIGLALILRLGLLIRQGQALACAGRHGNRPCHEQRGLAREPRLDHLGGRHRTGSGGLCESGGRRDRGDGPGGSLNRITQRDVDTPAGLEPATGE